MGKIASISSAAFSSCGLGIDPHLGHDGFDIRGVSGQEMDRGGLAVATAAKGLAVDRQVVGRRPA